MRELLFSPAFWAKENRATLVKSPADLVVGTLRTLEIRVQDALPFAFTMRNLGQDLFATPKIRGWPGGEAWINSLILLARKQFVERLLQTEYLLGKEMPCVEAHLVLGSRVCGGLYGEASKLDRINGNGNLPFSLDYRSLYSTPRYLIAGGAYPLQAC